MMDIKMGRRTFLESEVTNTKRREDLAAKMAKLDPAALTEEERTHGVTKLQYMQYREQLSSTATLGWRIEGLPDMPPLAGVGRATVWGVGRARRDPGVRVRCVR